LRYFKDEKDAYLSGLWCQAHLFNHQPAIDKLKADYSNLVMITTDNAGGGMFVPDPMLSTIIDLREVYGIARQKCKIQPMSSETLTIPRRLSGLTVYFVGQEAAPTESEPQWNQVGLTARTLATLTRVSNELSEDSTISMAETLAQEIAYAMAVKEDQCLFLGTGTSTYGGISGLITEMTAATASTVTAATANTAYSTLDLTDFESMIGKLPSFPGIRPEWYIHKSAWAASMMRLADAAGGNTSENIEGMRKEMFLGYPVNHVNVMNSTLTAQTSAYGICYFGDMSMATTFGDRRGVSVSSSTERYFEYRQTGILGHERFDINVHDVGNTTKAGAMIMLGMPAS
jgi:HK97 family phage major capsid protein